MRSIGHDFWGNETFLYYHYLPEMDAYYLLLGYTVLKYMINIWYTLEHPVFNFLIAIDYYDHVKYLQYFISKKKRYDENIKKCLHLLNLE